MRRGIFARGLDEFNASRRDAAQAKHRLLLSSAVRKQPPKSQIGVDAFNFNRYRLVEGSVITVPSDCIMQPTSPDKERVDRDVDPDHVAVLMVGRAELKL